MSAEQILQDSDGLGPVPLCDPPDATTKIREEAEAASHALDEAYKKTAYDAGYAEGRHQAAEQIKELNRNIKEHITEHDEARGALTHQIDASAKAIGHLGGEVSKIEDKLRRAVRWKHIPGSGPDKRTLEQLVDEAIFDRDKALLDKDTAYLEKRELERHHRDQVKQLDAIRVKVRAQAALEAERMLIRKALGGSEGQLLDMVRRLVSSHEALVTRLQTSTDELWNEANRREDANAASKELGAELVRQTTKVGELTERVADLICEKREDGKRVDQLIAQRDDLERRLTMEESAQDKALARVTTLMEQVTNHKEDARQSEQARVRSEKEMSRHADLRIAAEHKVTMAEAARDAECRKCSDLGRRYDDLVARIASALAVAASVSVDPKAVEHG